MDFDIRTTRTGENPLKLERINVFLGANGTGKSKLIEEIRNTIHSVLPEHQILNIEGGRALTMFDSLELDRTNFGKYGSYEKSLSVYQKKRSGTLQSRLFDGLKTLEQLAEASKMEHSDAVTAWLKTEDAKTDPESVPARAVDPMDRVFESFSDIFPSIKLNYNVKEKRLRCAKNGSRYGPTSLSDGEKQVFSILVDVVELAENRTVLFVDEPELNLHPSLANKLWTSVESILPEGIFIYATHSVNFAMRENVDKLLVLSDVDDNIQELENLDELPSKDKKELLGNISSLIANKKTLLVEGDDDSFDSIFYNWLIQDNQISPSAVGGCEDVIAIVKRAGKWKHISPNVTLAGIIDRDYKSQIKIDESKSRGVIVLDLHEAESYLCDPDLLDSVAKSIGTVDPIPTKQEMVQEICSFAEGIRLKIIARRVACRLDIRIGVSVPGKTLKKVTSEEQLKTILLADAADQKKHVSESYDETTVSKLVDEESAVVAGCLSRSDPEELLAIIPGKELLGALAPKVGCVDANAVARAVRHHLSQSDYGAISALRAKILAVFADAEPSQVELR